MLSKKLKNQLNSLYDLSFELSEALDNELLASEVERENFHPGYKKNRKYFSRLIKSAIRTERGVNRVHREATRNIWRLVNWEAYTRRLLRGAILTDSVAWKDIRVGLMVVFTETLDDAFEVGGLSAQVELGVTTGFSVAEPKAQEALRKHTLKLAGGITDHTKELVRRAIARSVDLGENQEQATDRLAAVINNRDRAGKIAHTEAVRAYSAGRLEVGHQVGARYKVWRDGQPGVCKTCLVLHNKKVRIDEPFKSDIGEVDYPPLHPHCRCLLTLEM